MDARTVERAFAPAEGCAVSWCYQDKGVIVNPLTYLQTVGRAKADETAAAAGLNPRYFNQICYGHRAASTHAARALVKASKGKHAMTLIGIIEHRVKRRGKKVVAIGPAE